MLPKVHRHPPRRWLLRHAWTRACAESVTDLSDSETCPIFFDLLIAQAVLSCLSCLLFVIWPYILIGVAFDRNHILIPFAVLHQWRQEPPRKPIPPHPYYLFTESGPSGSPSGYHLRQREGHRLLQAFHDTGDKYPVPQAQRHQSWGLLLPQPSLAWYLDVYSAGLLGCQLCAVCHSQVTCHPSLLRCPHFLFAPSTSFLADV